jgi:hypothetical protein
MAGDFEAGNFDNDTSTATVADRLESVGTEIKKRRGRPPGSKNRPKDGSEPASSGINLSASNQRKIFGGALIALFSLLAIVLAWFGYEQVEKLTTEEAEEGGTYLLPLSEKIGWLATAMFYLSFPAWLLRTANAKFAKRKAEPVSTASSNDTGSRPAGDASPVSPSQGANGTPIPASGGFISQDPPIPN